jgi:hypothetical protein
MSGEIDTLFTAEGVRAEILTTAYDTLHILEKHLNEVVLRPLDRHTDQLLDRIHAIVTMYAERSGLQQSQLKEEAVQTLDQMRQVLVVLLPEVVVLLPEVSNQQPPRCHTAIVNGWSLGVIRWKPCVNANRSGGAFDSLALISFTLEVE